VVTVDVGDLLLVHTTRRASRWISAASALAGNPSLIDHIAVVHHQDANGTWWVIEGRPGGVGWHIASAYLDSPHVLTNARQPKTPAQRAGVAELALGLLGTPYDWSVVVADAMAALGAQELWGQNWKGQGPPGHVVCSSLAAYGYERVKLDVPSRASPRRTTPADWAQFVRVHDYG
jgi:cell wall-associated NlpC family hydrolase